MYGYESLTVHDLCGVIIGDEILNIEIQFNLFSRAHVSTQSTMQHPQHSL